MPNAHLPVQLSMQRPFDWNVLLSAQLLAGTMYREMKPLTCGIRGPSIDRGTVIDIRSRKDESRPCEKGEQRESEAPVGEEVAHRIVFNSFDYVWRNGIPRAGTICPTTVDGWLHIHSTGSDPQHLLNSPVESAMVRPAGQRDGIGSSAIKILER